MHIAKITACIESGNIYKSALETQGELTDLKIIYSNVTNNNIAIKIISIAIGALNRSSPIESSRGNPVRLNGMFLVFVEYVPSPISSCQYRLSYVTILFILFSTIGKS